jgi:hypothetical protein
VEVEEVSRILLRGWSPVLGCTWAPLLLGYKLGTKQKMNQKDGWNPGDGQVKVWFILILLLIWNPVQRQQTQL